MNKDQGQMFLCYIGIKYQGLSTLLQWSRFWRERNNINKLQKHIPLSPQQQQQHQNIFRLSFTELVGFKYWDNIGSLV